MWNVLDQVNANVGMDVLPIAPSSPSHHVMNLKFPWYVFRYETLVPPSKPQSISFYHPLPLSSFEKSNSSYALRTYRDIWLPFWACEKLDGNGYTLGPITDDHWFVVNGGTTNKGDNHDRYLMVRQLMVCSIFSSKYSPSPSVCSFCCLTNSISVAG